MKIIRSELLENKNNLVFGFSTKDGLNRNSPFFFNLSLNVGDNPDRVEENREHFFQRIGLNNNQIAYQKQIHSDIIKFVEEPGFIGESDAMITTKKNIGLAVSGADCTTIYLYDKENQIIAAVHSGWRGTHKKILLKTLKNLVHHFSSAPKNLFAFVAPAISQKNYEVGEEVAVLFDQKYLAILNSKLYLDVSGINIDFLKQFGIPATQIEISSLCTFAEDYLHSYRRDGKNSGRALGVIAMKENV